MHLGLFTRARVCVHVCVCLCVCVCVCVNSIHQGDEAAQQQAREVLCVILELVRIAAVALTPLTPSLATRCLEQLGLPPSYVQVGYEVTSTHMLHNVVCGRDKSCEVQRGA